MPAPALTTSCLQGLRKESAHTHTHTHTLTHTLTHTHTHTNTHHIFLFSNASVHPSILIPQKQFQAAVRVA
jgi:hypothetical protein